MVNKLPLTREEVPNKVYSWRWATRMSGFLPAFLFVSRQSYVLIYIPPKISARNCNIFLHGVFLWAVLPFIRDWRALLRFLRRQHCSSLCSQSEGHEHVANMANALAHDFVGFLAVFGRHNIRPPHFASKVSYSAAPQTFAEGSRSAAAPERGSYSRIGACPYLSSQLINSRFCPCKGRISLAGLASQ